MGAAGPGTNALRAAIRSVVGISDALGTSASRQSDMYVTADIPYADEGCPQQMLDVVRLRDARGVQPALIYIHGGGFAACSKRTHRSFALRYARRGFTVFNIDYRLMPENRYPAAFHDSARALLWVMQNAAKYGADPEQIVIAGESAGGNLTLGLAVAASYDLKTDKWAAKVFDSNPSIKAILPACAILQVSNCARLWRETNHIPGVARRIFRAMEQDYLPLATVGPACTDFADPLKVVERQAPDRELPPTFVYCGTRDFLYPDSQRLALALHRQGATYRFYSYEGEDHAFHAFPNNEQAKRAWRDQARFLQQHVFGDTAPGC